MDSGPLVPGNAQANYPTVREMQPAAADFGRTISPRIYPELLSQESVLGEYIRVLIKRKWTVLACLLTIFSLVAIASLKETHIYAHSGSLRNNKPHSAM